MKILKYYNSTILYKSPKNPIFVQLSPIQCTYSNIFIRFFKFFPANTNIYQISYRVTACCAAYARVSCHCERKIGDPAGYCVLAGKRNKQAKDRQLSRAAIVWSKAQFMTRSVQFVITMRLPYFIRYEVLNVITMRCPFREIATLRSQ